MKKGTAMATQAAGASAVRIGYYVMCTRANMWSRIYVRSNSTKQNASVHVLCVCLLTSVARAERGRPSACNRHTQRAPGGLARAVAGSGRPRRPELGTWKDEKKAGCKAPPPVPDWQALPRQARIAVN